MQTVIDTLVNAAKEHLDEAVTNGRLTQEEADAKLVEITERITEMVNTARPRRRLILRVARNTVLGCHPFRPPKVLQPRIRRQSSPQGAERPRSTPCTGSAGAVGCDP